MKAWNVSGNGKPWTVELDVRDLGGHLDFTRRAGAGTLSSRVREATHGVAAVGALHLLLTSAAEIGFAWDGGEQGWVRTALPPLRMLSGPVQHFQSAILEA